MTQFISSLSNTGKRFFLAVVALFVSILAIYPDAHAHSDHSAAAESVPESIDVSFAAMQLIPYGFRDDNGVVTGYFYEVAHAMLEGTGLEYQLSLLPLKRLVVEMKRGQKDCVFIARTPISEKLFRFVEPIGINITGGIVPAAGKAIKRYDDLSQFTLGIPRGVSFDARLDADNSLTKVITPDYAGSVKMLLAQRVSAIAGNLDSFNYYARKIGEKPQAVFGEPLIMLTAPIWLACGLSQPADEVVDRLKASLKTLRDDGTVQRIFDYYQ